MSVIIAVDGVGIVDNVVVVDDIVCIVIFTVKVMMLMISLIFLQNF